MQGYRIFNGQIHIYPLASSNRTDGIKLFYYKQRTLPSTDTEDTGIKDDRMLVDWALSQVLISDGDLNRSELYRRNFEVRKNNIRGNQPTPHLTPKNYWG